MMPELFCLLLEMRNHPLAAVFYSPKLLEISVVIRYSIHV